MDIKIILIKKAIGWLLGGAATSTINIMVANLWNEDLSNDEKRAKVKAVVKPLITEVGKFFLSTAIAFAVDSLRAKLDGN